MKKTVIYNDTEVVRVEPEQGQYSSVNEGEYMVVQTLPLVKLMLQARGIDTAVIDNYYEYFIEC
jgi:hypothetical protein